MLYLLIYKFENILEHIAHEKNRCINKKNTAKILKNPQAAFDTLHLLRFVLPSCNNNHLVYTSTANSDSHTISNIYAQTKHI